MQRKDQKYVYTSRLDFEKSFQLSSNLSQNQQITHASVQLIKYIEKNLGVTIREVKFKFIFDFHGLMYFTGFKEFLCSLRNGKRLLTNLTSV